MFFKKKDKVSKFNDVGKIRIKLNFDGLYTIQMCRVVPYPMNLRVQWFNQMDSSGEKAATFKTRACALLIIKAMGLEDKLVGEKEDE